MNLDQLITRLIELRNEYGGQTPVFVTVDNVLHTRVSSAESRMLWDSPGKQVLAAIIK